MKNTRSKKPFWKQEDTSKTDTSTSEPFSTEHLYDIITKTNHPMRLDDILRRSHITRRSKKEVINLLLELTKSGKIVRLSGGAYAVANQLVTVQGSIAIQRSGAGFVTPMGESKGSRENDIYIPPHAVRDAWNEDIVEVNVFPQGRTNSSKKLKREGEVARVITRTHTDIGVCIEELAEAWHMKFIQGISDQAFLARPTDGRLNFMVLVPNTLSSPIARNTLCLVRIKEQLPSSLEEPLWLCEPLQVLGMEDSVSVQEHLTKLNHGIPTTFPDDVEDEAKGLAKEEGFTSENGLDYASRDSDVNLDEHDVDLRSFNLVTIDGADARDFDDAIYVKRNADGYQLIVAIADVSRFVTPSSKMDREARIRANSYYFPNSVEPMLPEALSNGICSLRPHENHRVMFADMQFNPQGIRIKNNFGQGIMRSKARLTYTEVQEYYSDKASATITPEILPMLDNARDLAQLLIQNRLRSGSLHLELPEPVCVVEDNKIKGMTTRSHFFAHELIEAFMVSANESVAEFLSSKNAPCLYRVHPSPAPERMESLAEGLNLTGHQDILPTQTPQEMGSSSWISHVLFALQDAKKKALQKPLSKDIPKDLKDGLDKNSSRNLNDTSIKNESTPRDATYLVHRLILRSMMQARYTPALDMHFGLASQCYCHFTSPIRRYADLIVHRSLKMQLKLIPKQIKTFSDDALTQTAEICNERERIAQTAEREIYRRMACLLLTNQEGKEFDAIISGVTNYGIFAELTENMAEGMIVMDDLGDDYFVYEEESQSLYGSRTNVQYRLGDTIRVRLVSVSLGRLEINLAPVGVIPRPARKGKPARNDRSAKNNSPKDNSSGGKNSKASGSAGKSGSKSKSSSGKSSNSSGKSSNSSGKNSNSNSKNSNSNSKNSNSNSKSSNNKSRSDKPKSRDRG